MRRSGVRFAKAAPCVGPSHGVSGFLRSETLRLAKRHRSASGTHLRWRRYSAVLSTHRRDNVTNEPTLSAPPRTSPFETRPVDTSFNATIELATTADPEHAAAILDHHADYHQAVVRTEAGRAELILTLPAEDLDHATPVRLPSSRPPAIRRFGSRS